MPFHLLSALESKMNTRPANAEKDPKCCVNFESHRFEKNGPITSFSPTYEYVRARKKCAFKARAADRPVTVTAVVPEDGRVEWYHPGPDRFSRLGPTSKSPWTH